jgi:acyl CoA:acetate/3-ketoacid CoA transferase alpha subunit/acyl CoA:acetate/3-ketoacid CoA transferase beta subunit
MPVDSSKVMSLEQAIPQFVQPGDTVHVVYSEARPNAALMALVREFAGKHPRLSLVTSGLVSVQHALVEAGVVEHVTASFIGENYPSARPNRSFQRALAENRVTVSSWSMWSLMARLIAGALGVPYLPTRSLTGSSMFRDLVGADVAEVTDPFSGSSVTVVSALNPDVALVHGVAADKQGNVFMSAPYGEAHWGSLAARRGVIATVEGLMSDEMALSLNSLVKIPGHLVRAVCVVPLGSHPYGLYNPGVPGIEGYEEDFDFITEVFAASQSSETFTAWIAEWILGTSSHTEYLEKLSKHRKVAAREALEDRPMGPSDRDTDTWTAAEFQVVATARRAVERVQSGGHQAVLAGVGLANLAAWLADGKLRDAGVTVQLMAELGMYGYKPKPGDPFIFAHQNLSTCQSLTDVPMVLGALVGGPSTRTLGLLGAGQVDGHGNVNSTYDASGRYLVGSGGANDVASGADEVLLTVEHRRARLPTHLPYITCPGTNVRSIVTSSGVFERIDKGFVLLRYLPDGSGDDDRATVERLRSGCEWEFDVSRELAVEPAPSHDELTALRAYDPRRIFV